MTMQPSELRQKPPADPEAAALQQSLRAGPSPFAPVFHGGTVETLCLWTCKVLIVAMVVIIGTELVTRNLFGFSFQLSDEYGGYLLAALCFFSLSVGHSNGYFHRVEFLQARLPEVGQAFSAIIFEALSLLFSVVMLWEVALLEWGSWKSGELTSTILMTPLWIPQLTLPLGAAALCWSVGRRLVVVMRWFAAAERRRGA